MGFDRDRRNKRGGGRGRGDGFGEEFSGDYGGPPPVYGNEGGGGGGRGGFGGGDRSGGGGGGRGGFGGGDRGGGGGFGGGAPRSQMPAQVVGEGKGVVKFFNAAKGFGFVVRDDGEEDVFVHISAVEQAGLEGLADGQPLGFTLVERGGKISAIDLVIDGEPMPVEARAPREPREGGFDRDRGPRNDSRGGDRGGFGGDRGGDRGGFGGGGRPQRQLTGERTSGTVKFFNGTKGFGFISRDDGEADAFVHVSAVQRAGMHDLQEGDRLDFDIEVDGRGKFAAVNLANKSE
jgi:cold shock protein